MSREYHPKEYWEHRLKQHFDLRGVGRIGFNEFYNAWLYRRKKHCIATIFAAANLKGKTVLDVGCGTGFFIDWFLQHGAIVSGMDITEISVATLKARFGSAVFRQDISDEHYVPRQLFDIVNMWDVVYHIVETDSFIRTFTNIAQSLKSGGLLLVTDWLGCISDVQLANHVQGRCLATYLRTLPTLGFELIRVMPVYITLNILRFRSLTERLGMVFYLFDKFCSRMSRCNLSLAVWRYSKPDIRGGQRASSGWW
jgi:2-polyprenyl-3-methyl-5-hydroxy-6-metoxy-1,4-benzoquinol methylase